MLRRKAQSAIEFVILVGFILFVFVAFFMTVQQSMSGKLRERREISIKEVALTVRDELNLAFEASEGYYREFELPEKLGSLEYEVSITEGLVYVKTEDEENAIALPVVNVTGDTRKGINVIKKEGGEIKLN